MQGFVSSAFPSLSLSKSVLTSTFFPSSVESLLLAVDEVNSSSSSPLLLTSCLLPTSTEMISQISTLSLSQIAPALAVIDPLVPQLPEGPSARSAESDLYGYSSFARLATAVSLILSSDRSLLRSNLTWIRVLSTYNLFASDELALPGSSKHVFGSEVVRGELEGIVKSGDALRSYALSSMAGSLEVGWHQASISAIGSGKTEGKDGACALLGELVEAAREGEDIYASRVLRDLLAGVLQYSGAGVAEAEGWLMFGRTLQDKGELLSFDLCSMILDATRLILLLSSSPSSPSLPRYRLRRQGSLPRVSSDGSIPKRARRRPRRVQGLSRQHQRTSIPSSPRRYSASSRLDSHLPPSTTNSHAHADPSGVDDE